MLLQLSKLPLTYSAEAYFAVREHSALEAVLLMEALELRLPLRFLLPALFEKIPSRRAVAQSLRNQHCAHPHVAPTARDRTGPSFLEPLPLAVLGELS
jgi:hypothetical protein